MNRKLLSQVLLFTAIILSFVYPFPFLENIPYANATSGAYTSTKHGGGTVDGVPGSGVNRGVNLTDYPGGQYLNTTEGIYQAGECAHCHEAHASFGGTEPPPYLGGDAGPDAYLVMKDYGGAANYSNMCWYCHDNIAGGGGPGTGYYNFYQGSTKYNASSHLLNSDGGLAMSWPGGTAGAPGVGATTDAVATWPRRGRTALPSGNNGSCVNCHTPHGIKGSYDATGAAPTATNYLTGGTAAATELIPRQLIAREEALCLNCHDTDGPAATNIKTQVDNWGFLAPTQWSATQGSGHPTREATYYNRHNLAGSDGLASTLINNEPPSAGGWFTSATKHAECIDCHNPHTAQGRGSAMAAPWYGNVFQGSQGTNWGNPISWNPNRYDTPTDSTSSPVKIGPVNKGVWGVTVTASQGTITGTNANLDPAAGDRLYQLCLKCHSYWAWGGANVNTPIGAGAAPLWNSPSSTRTFTATRPAAVRSNLSMSNQAWEFATDGVPPATAASVPSAGNRVAYHPVFNKGRNRPELYTQQFATGTRNPCWCANTTCPPTAASYTTTSGGQGNYGVGDCTNNTTIAIGVRAIGARADLTGNMIATLSENFVPPWLHTSTITCVDCHENSTETTATPRGPHGSARPYVLRRLDSTISYTKCLTANCATTTIYTYVAVNTNDPDNLCLNCHRADVYGYWLTNSILPNFARQSHVSFNNGDGFAARAPTSAPNGILCMICHGGNRNKLGAIHGNDYTATACATNCTTAGRLIAADGVAANSGEWQAWTKSAVATAGSCTKNTASPYCGNTSGGAFNAGANYNY